MGLLEAADGPFSRDRYAARMPTLVALLRGINVGGRKRVAMAPLRETVEELGFSRVSTYIQSGNIVCEATPGRAATAETVLHDGIREAFGIDVVVITRSAPEMATIVSANPFLSSGADPKHLGVVFFQDTPTVEPVFEPEAHSPDEFTVRGREILLHYPNGFGKASLTHSFLEKQYQVPATIRNWNTVTKLAELAGVQ